MNRLFAWFGAVAPHGANLPHASASHALGARLDVEADAAVTRATAGAGVHVQGLRMAYGTVPALDDLALQVQPGEALGLLGPNGAGKSTLMHVLAGVLRPQAGRVDVA